LLLGLQPKYRTWDFYRCFGQNITITALTCPKLLNEERDMNQGLSSFQADAGRVNVSEPLFMLDYSRFEMVNSRYAMTSICNILMNLTVLEPQFVAESQVFFQLLKFIMNSLPTLVNDGKPQKMYLTRNLMSILYRPLLTSACKPIKKSFPMTYHYVICHRFGGSAQNPFSKVQVGSTPSRYIFL